MFRIHAIEYHLVDHCNLNCSGCTHFSPLAEPRFADIDKFEKNLNRLQKVFSNFRICSINLLGGEPLLHPEVTEFIKIARSYFKLSEINLKTNGILLCSMNDSFYSECRKNKINIVVTNYLNLDIKRFYGIQYKIEECKKFYYNYIVEEKNFNNFCNNPCFKNYYNCCSQLDENGDFHFCGYSANINFYNKYYSKNIPIEKDKDYFNIYSSELSEFEIIKSFYSKRPFCYYCSKHILGDWSVFNNTNKWKSDK